jgi:tryptophanyl-tRNA synthetase
MSIRLMTGARPTGGLHVGQYLAAFEPFVKSALKKNSFFIVSDLHMMTTKFTPEATRSLPTAICRLVSEAIAFGVDPTETDFYLQSSMPWQARLYVILQCLADRLRLERHESFSEMAAASSAIRAPTLGLLGYPVLESSDVMAMAATHVTVGVNNHSHFDHLREILLELDRGWGLSLNAPEVVTGRANLIGLDGDAKMSKSLNNALLLSDDPDALSGKLKRMVAAGPAGVPVAAEYLTALGADSSLVEQAKADALRNLVSPEIREHLTDLVISFVEPIRRRAHDLQANRSYLVEVLRKGTNKANEIGEIQYRKFTDHIGMMRS